MSSSSSPFNPWLWQMAWRDSRKSRQRLLLFMSSIMLGIAALVAINSFAINLEKSIDDQAKELLGADLALSTNKPVSPEAQQLIDSIGQERSEERGFASMVFFPKNSGTRLIQVKALQGNFPYFGEVETIPADAFSTFKQGGKKALVDDVLMTQFNIEPGDSVKIGETTFYIIGRILKMPGQSAVSTTVAPTVYIPLNYLDGTGLVQRGSRINYKFYYQLPGTDVEKLAETLEPRLDKEGINSDTVEERKEEIGRTFANMTRFLNLVGFIALLLGCVGVASAIHLYVKEKLASVAVLRCLGAGGWQTFYIFLIQTFLMGFTGALMGALLGSAIQFVLPEILGEFLPVDVAVTIAWAAIGQGVGIGLTMAVLFALLPLLSIRRISPLRTLRASFEEDTSAKDPARWLIYGLIILFVGGFAYLQIRDWRQALGFTVGICVAFLLLTGMGILIMYLVRRFFPVSWSYVWRQSLANLYRPQNQTLILIIAIGLGTFLISTLYVSQNLLLDQVTLSGSGNQPNMVLFDIQTNQKEAVVKLAKDSGIPILQEAPIVTMRLSQINGRTVEAIQKDTSAKIPDWALTREYRVTYRDKLITSEKLQQGQLRKLNSPSDSIFVSVEDRYLERMKLKIGDELVFNVQGSPIKTYVGSTREIDWNRVQTNFLIVFPNGVLEEAPQFHVLVTKVKSSDQSAKFQRELVQAYPNVSAIDLGLILRTIDEILNKVSFVIQFMALFSIITGLIVLSSSVIISKYQRIQESVLLRTLGANSKQIIQISIIEYLFLGALATLSGILLSLISSWLLALFVFEVPFQPVLTPLMVVLVVVTGLTVLIGMLNSRGVLNRPPLEILRTEV
ncbi:FtsX-like permease family protein [Rhodocytophaga aerolata]|uniref:FtsX-like permease family protein n=1 Tax=Rhodocytophaga aerolata TaxID=455078 RepID=A0ABT8RE64_9BACT|nr:FtsX-like permease family protein [Rhodocytophaga aerolata]MDO1450395.1 FtsX-like permease family protein [Rhodocytophaga aerolata]